MPANFDPQQMIVTMLAVKLLRLTPTVPVILSSAELKELAQYTVRLEIVNPQDPANSPIKCSLMSVADAAKFLAEMNRTKGKP